MVMNISCKFEKGSYNIFLISVKISPKMPKMASVRYFGGLWMTFNEELQGQISACLQRTYICIIYTSLSQSDFISFIYVLVESL